METFLQTVLNTLILSVVWFIAGGIVYMNPLVAKVYKKYHEHKSMKHWGTRRKYLSIVFFLGILMPAFLLTLLYAYLIPRGVLELTLLLVGVRFVPRFADMFIQTCYPNKLLLIELINGTILSFVVAVTLNILPF